MFSLCFEWVLKVQPLGRGCGQVVSVLAFYSNNPSLNLTDAYIFSVKFVFKKNENKQKEAGFGPFSKKLQAYLVWSLLLLPWCGTQFFKMQKTIFDFFAF